MKFTSSLAFLSFAPVAFSSKATTTHLRGSSNDAATPLVLRNLQDANYRAQYKGRFQYLLAGCSGARPVLQAFCAGSIDVLGTSHDTIICSSLDASVEPGWNGVQCVNTCEDSAACRGVFLDNGNVAGGAFGEIEFECSGPNVTDVDSFFTYEAGPDGSCEANYYSYLENRNFHVAQLGIFCEDPNSADGGAYSYGDYYFECGTPNTDNGKFDGIYTCFQGENCGYSACNVEFDRIAIHTDVQNLDCIQSLDGTPVPDIPTPEIAPRPEGEYTAQFRSNWELDLGSQCTGKYPLIRMTCSNGDIRLIGTVYDTTSCTEISSNVIECMETAESNFVNKFSGAIYECTASSEIPTTVIEYEDATATCNSFGGSVSRHKLQLGISCDNGGGSFWYYDDYYSECQNGDNYWYEGPTNERYTCYEFATTKDGETAPIGLVQMYTDDRWSREAFGGCYSYKPLGSSGTSVKADPASAPLAVQASTHDSVILSSHDTAVTELKTSISATPKTVPTPVPSISSKGLKKLKTVVSSEEASNEPSDLLTIAHIQPVSSTVAPVLTNP